MGEAVGEARPAVDFGEKLGDAQTRQHGVEPAYDGVGRLVLRFANRADRQAVFGERGLWQLTCGGESVDFAKSGFQTLGLFIAPILETIGDGKARQTGLRKDVGGRAGSFFAPLACSTRSRSCGNEIVLTTARPHRGP